MIITRSDEYVVLKNRYYPNFVFETVLAPVPKNSELNHYFFFDFNRARFRMSTLCDRRKQGNLTFLSELINGEVDALHSYLKL